MSTTPQQPEPSAAETKFVEEIDTILSCGNPQSSFAYPRVAKLIAGRIAAALQAERTANAELRLLAAKLWMLLDDIDTQDDASKSNDAHFRKCCYEIQQRRHAILSGEKVEEVLRAARTTKP